MEINLELQEINHLVKIARKMVAIHKGKGEQAAAKYYQNLADKIQKQYENYLSIWQKNYTKPEKHINEDSLPPID